MSRIISKRKQNEIRKQREKKKTRKKEIQDSKGISRKKLKCAIDPKLFIVLKIISIVIVPICYLFFSYLLIFSMLFSVSMFVFAVLTERKINHTYVKSNHIKILKIDSIIAFIVLLIVVVSIPISMNTKKSFPKFRGNAINSQLVNISTCLTGNRNLFRIGGFMFKFGVKEFPADMPMPDKDFEGFPEFDGEFPNNFNGDFKPPMDGKNMMKNLPVEAIFSQVLTSINTVLIFLVPITGLITLKDYMKKKNRHEEIDEIEKDNLADFDSIDFEKIFLFGYYEEENA